MVAPGGVSEPRAGEEGVRWRAQPSTGFLSPREVRMGEGWGLRWEIGYIQRD